MYALQCPSKGNEVSGHHPHLHQLQVNILLYYEFKNLHKYSKARMIDKWVKEKLEPFITILEQGLDIRTTDATFRKSGLE